MSKFFQAFLSGLFFTFFLDFFLFLGMKINYIDLYEIKIFYNTFFAENQNIYIYLFMSAFIGYLVIYVRSATIKVSIVGVLLLLSLSTLIQEVGYRVGLMMFAHKNVTLRESRYTFTGDIYYSGRKYITFYDYDLDKIIQLNKKELK